MSPPRYPHFRLGLAAALALSAAAPLRAQARNYRDGADQVRELRGTLPAGAGGVETLQIDVELGAVQLTGGSGTDIEYTLRIRVPAGKGAPAYLSSWPVLIERTGRRAELQTGAPPGNAPNLTLARGRLSLQVVVPASVANLWATTSVGDISANQLGGTRLTLASGAGAIAADGDSGGLQATSAAGDIVLGHVGQVSARAAGSIRIERADGTATLTTTGGDIRLRQGLAAVHVTSGGGAVEMGDIGGELIVVSSGGNIHVAKVKDGRLQTSGGSIAVDGAGQLNCATTSGDIELRNLLGGVQAQTGRGQIDAAFAAGVRFTASELISDMGGVAVSLPTSLAAMLQAEIRAPDGHQVQSDYPGWAPLTLNLRDMVDERMRLNGGGPALQLVATASDITIRKQ